MYPPVYNPERAAGMHRKIEPRVPLRVSAGYFWLRIYIHCMCIHLSIHLVIYVHACASCERISDFAICFGCDECHVQIVITKKEHAARYEAV
jgi:hypothetical protein